MMVCTSFILLTGLLSVATWAPGMQLLEHFSTYSVQVGH